MVAQEFWTETSATRTSVDAFPRYVWAFEDAMWFEARVTNIAKGSYKGYPLADDQAPKGATR